MHSEFTSAPQIGTKSWINLQFSAASQNILNKIPSSRLKPQDKMVPDHLFDMKTDLNLFMLFCFYLTSEIRQYNWSYNVSFFFYLLLGSFCAHDHTATSLLT